MSLVWDSLFDVAVSGFGVVLIAIGIANVRRIIERLLLRMRGYRAAADIVSVLEEKDSDDHPEYRLTVEFVTRTGEHRRADVVYPVRRPRRTGDRTWVLYRPDDPGYVVLPSFEHIVLTLLFFPALLVSGTVFILIGVDQLLGMDTVPLWPGFTLRQVTSD